MVKPDNERNGSFGPPVIIAAVCIACLAPFVAKAFNMDDPLFLWIARQIQSHPFDFYGFQVNWYGQEMPMSDITKNPPLTSYYIALIASILGWNETGLHMAFLLPAIAASLGIFFLAQELCLKPMAAALAGMLTPVFLLSGTTVMCDTIMLAWWVWAVWLWMRGIKENKNSYLLLAALFIAMCSLTKYFGMSLIPLLFVYGYARKRRPGRWALFLLIPVVFLCGYQLLTYSLYGRGLLLDAASYASNTSQMIGPALLVRVLTGLSFTGGCVVTALLYSPLAWRKRALVAGALLALFSAWLLSRMDSFGHVLLNDSYGVRWQIVAQCALFIVAGLNVFALAVADLWNRKDAESLLLFLWVAGTFVFASFFNWTVNGRSILPMVPAVGIIVMRRLEDRSNRGNPQSPSFTLLPLAPALLISLSVAWADYGLANSARTAASEFAGTYEPAKVWFQGHWGFQYYMEKLGFKAYDFDHPPKSPGDLVILPQNNTNIVPPTKGTAIVVDGFQFTSSQFLTTMNKELGAGFYADLWGPLPFAVGRVSSEKYYVMKLSAPQE